MNILGLGQVNAPQMVHNEVEMNGAQQEEVGEQEEVFQGGAASNNDAFLFAGDPPPNDID